MLPAIVDTRAKTARRASSVTSSRLLIITALACLLAAIVLGRRHLRLRRGLRGVFEGFFPTVFAFVAITRFAMSPRIKRIVLVGGLALCLIPVLMHEPLHKGKPVRYWVDGACGGYDSIESWQFRQEVKHIGPAAVPRLARKLGPWDGWRDAYRSLQTFLPPRLQQLFPKVLSEGDVEAQRYGAAKALALLGADAKPAVGSLVKLLTRPEYPSLAGHSYPVTHAVISALAAIGPGGKKALPVLHSLLTNQDVSLHVEIAGALWSIGWETNTVLDICTNALASTDMWVSSYAGFLLSGLKTAAAPAVPFALNLVQDTNRSVAPRASAAQVLGAARVSTPEIRAALLAGTQADQDPDLRSTCAMALWRLDAQYAPLATRLLLEDIISLRKRFPGSKQDFTEWPDIHTVKQLLESDLPEMRKEAAYALQEIEAKTETQTDHVNQIR